MPLRRLSAAGAEDGYRVGPQVADPQERPGARDVLAGLAPDHEQARGDDDPGAGADPDVGTSPNRKKPYGTAHRIWEYWNGATSAAGADLKAAIMKSWPTVANRPTDAISPRSPIGMGL